MPITITIPGIDLYDEKKKKFLTTEEMTIELEHSLASLSKWEQKWKIPFLNNKGLTTEHTIDYIRCMCLTPNVPVEAFNVIAYASDILQEVNDYIFDPMTATWFNDRPGQTKPSNEVNTSEVIYYWLVALTIPFETQYWHLNRLLTLIRVTNIKNDPKKKLMPKAEQMREQRDLNAERRAARGSRG